MNEKARITQEMIRIYYDYTHLTLDRRDFMQKLSRLAGSTAAAAAIVPMLEASKARAAIVPEDDARLTAETIAVVRVYDREREPCVTPGCRGTIRRLVQSGRSTFYCPVCQK